jgi:hypothetical protein
MSHLDNPLPEVLIFKGRHGSTLVVRHEGHLAEFDFQFISELPPMLLDAFPADVTGEVLRQCRAHMEGVV